MIITMALTAPVSTTTTLLDIAASLGLEARKTDDGAGADVVVVAGSIPRGELDLPGIVEVKEKHPAFMLGSREARPRARTIVRVGDVEIGASTPIVMAGPCVVEDRDELIEIAHAVKQAGASILRGGAFKPRTSPYAFQGLGERGLQHLADAREATGLPVVTEVMEPEQVEMVAHYADMLQIGARNMANFNLLKRAGMVRTPVLLKRGFSATMDEWLMSAEYLLAAGNPNVVLCERGIRGFDPAFRFNLDLNAVPHVKQVSHLPIIVDPSHGTGRRSLVGRMALAGIAAGADGVIIEAHPRPESALVDGNQTITPEELRKLTRQCEAVASLLAYTDAPLSMVAGD